MYTDGTVWGAPVRRAFSYVGNYEIHYRYATPSGVPVDPAATVPVVVCLHPSPASSLAIAPLISELGQYFQVLAPDTLGNGDSRGPIPPQPEIPFYASILADFLTARGVGSCAVYGCHTGAAIGIELALGGRIAVTRLILDGVGIYTPEFQQKLLAHYIPDLTPDQDGLYALRLWMMLRDMYLFWPWFERTAASHRPIDLPEALAMHTRYVETLKAVTTFGHSYKAAFGYDKAAALPQLDMPVMVTSAAGDMLSPSDRTTLSLLRNGVHQVNAGFVDRESAWRTGALFRAFLAGDPFVANATP